jgi:hypothetical protein
MMTTISSETGFMVTTEEFLDALGKPASSPEGQALLRELGVTKPVKLKKGDTKANVPVPKAGVELVFADEAFFFKRKDLAIGEGELLFTSVMFYAEIPGKWKAYPGPLPYGLSFSDPPAKVYEMLGKPEWSNEMIGNNRWSKDGRWLFVVFTPDKQAIQRVIVQIPDPR